MKYLKQFVIGSSFLVFAPFYYGVQNNQPKKNYDFYNYSLIAPVWFGLWNIISLIIADYFNFTKRKRFMVISLMSFFTIITFLTIFNTYNFTKTERIKYYIYLFIKYMIIWNLIIYYIEYNI